MTKQRKNMLILVLLLLSSTIPIASAEEQYQIKQSITAPTPTKYETFGGAVTMNSEVIIVGAPKGTSGGVSNSGVVYVFNLEGEYLYTIESPNPEPNAKFGESVTCSNEYILIGAYRETVDSKTEAGRLYLYDLEGNLLHQLQSPEPGFEAHFGDSMDIFGDTIIVADEYLNSNYYPKAYLFGTDGTLKSTIEPPVSMSGTGFGVNPRIGSDFIIISEILLGQVHIYSSDGEYLRTLESPMFYGMFGICNAINGGYLIIGESDANLVHVYDFGGNLLHTIKPPQGHTGDFGFYVASEGDLIVISEPNGDVDSVSGAGYVFVYNMDGDLLSMIHSPDPQRSAKLGGGQYPQNLLCISNERVVVGEYSYDSEELTDSGRVHIIEKGSFLVTLSDLSIEPTQIEEGESVTCSVKCNNDGSFAGDYKLVLSVDGQVMEEKVVSLAPGGSEVVSFEILGDIEGEYLVDVNGETISFDVKKAQTGIPGFSIYAMSIGLIIAVILYQFKSKPFF